MSETDVANEVGISMDQVYPNRELEFLSKNDPPDPLVFRISELVYRQAQKDELRKKQKKTAKAYVFIVSCLFMTMMAALIISTSLEQKPNKDMLLRINNTTDLGKNTTYASLVKTMETKIQELLTNVWN